MLIKSTSEGTYDIGADLAKLKKLKPLKMVEEKIHTRL